MLAEARTASEPVHCDEDAIPAAAKHEGNRESSFGVNAVPAEAVAVKACQVGLVFQAQRSQAPEGDAGNALLRVDQLADQSIRKCAGARRDDYLAAARVLDHNRARRNQRTPTLGDQLEHRVEFGFATECPGDLNRRVERLHGSLELRALRLDLPVALGMVDRDTRQVSQSPDGLLVLLGELVGAGLVGQVQVPNGMPATTMGTPRKLVIGG